MLTRMTYLVKTATGYVGRSSLTAPLTADQPRAFGYCYDPEEALAIAQRFDGVLEAVAPVKL